GGVAAVGREHFVVNGHEEGARCRSLKDGAFDFVGGGDIEEVDVGNGNDAGGGNGGVDAERLPDSDASEVEGAAAGRRAGRIGGRGRVEGGAGAGGCTEGDSGVVLERDGAAADGFYGADEVLDGVERARGLSGAR